MSEKINQSILLFTNDLIDYAGLFPPAKLDLNTSLNNYLKYKKGNNSQILSKFICPVKLLPELKQICMSIPEFTESINLSLILTGGDNSINFKNNFINDLEIINNFLNENILKFRADTYEYKIPEEITSNHDKEEFLELLNLLSENSAESGIKDPKFFAESILNEDWKKNIEFTADTIEVHNESNNDTGFKLRTGGIVTSAFPSSEQISYSILYCLKRDLEMKFTAGLHHPFRNYDKIVGTKMHGFINVFAAGIIAKRHNISKHEMVKLLEDESAENFIFTDKGMNWNGYELENEDIHFARKTFVKSYGSCSFDEPIEDLEKLNLLK